MQVSDDKTLKITKVVIQRSRSILESKLFGECEILTFNLQYVKHDISYSSSPIRLIASVPQTLKERLFYSHQSF